MAEDTVKGWEAIREGTAEEEVAFVRRREWRGVGWGGGGVMLRAGWLWDKLSRRREKTDWWGLNTAERPQADEIVFYTEGDA